MLKPLETSRLILRPLEKSDAERLFLLDSNPQVMKYVGQPILHAPEESAKVIEMIRRQYCENGTGRFAVVEKESGLLIGWNGLKLNRESVNGHQNFYELGYRLMPEFWGKGYAVESSVAFLNVGFAQMNLEVIYAYAHQENQASLKVLQKLGFAQTGTFEEPDGTCCWLELPKEKMIG